MKRNKIRETIEFAGLSYQKEITKITLINIVMLIGGVVLYFFLKNIIYSMFVLIALAVLDYVLI